MLKRSFLVLGLVGALTTLASADAIINYTSAVDTVPGTSDIDYDPTLNPGPFTINIGASSSAAAITNGGGFAFTFTGGGTANVGLDAFAWDAIFSDPNNWFADPTLPGPSVVSFAPALTLPALPGSLPIATLTTHATGNVGDFYDLATGAQAFDTNGGSIPVTGSSGGVRINIVPEPATLALLLIGGVTAIRRRS